MVLLAYGPGSFCQPYSFLHSELTMGETKRTENKASGRCQASFFIVEFCKLKHFFV